MSEQWVQETTAFDRVSSIAVSIDEQPVSKIADEACVAENTARKHLNKLSELGIILEDEKNGTTTYSVDPLYLRMNSVRNYIDEYELDDLITLKASLQDDIEEITGNYDVSSPTELRMKASESQSAAGTRKLMKLAGEWELLLSQINDVSEAIEKYKLYQK